MIKSRAMRRSSTWIPLLLSVILIGGVVAVAQYVSGPASHATTSSGETPAPEVRWVAAAPGRVEPRGGEVKLGAPVLSRVLEVLVEPRQSVTAGDLLIHLDDDELTARVRGAEEQVAARLKERDINEPSGKAARDIRTAEDAVASAETAFWTRRDELDDLLRAARFATAEPEKITAARGEVASLSAKLEEARKALATLKASAGAPLPTPPEAALASARAERAVARTLREKLRIRAPMDASVLQVPVKPGETVTPSPELPLVTIGDLSVLRVSAEVEERDAAKIAVGQVAMVRADAYPGKEFPAKVVEIAPSLTAPKLGGRGFKQRSDIDILEVKVELDAGAPLVPGMRVDVLFKPMDGAAKLASQPDSAAAASP